MTNAELLAKIKAEIERLKEEAYNSILPDEPKYRTHYKVGKKELCEELLSFISTIESEKPMNLEEEIKRYYDDWDGDCRYAQTARHFAQWGADHTPLPEDTVLFNKGVEEGKRLMMEVAVEGEVVKDISNKLAVTAKINLDGFKFGDKVRVIVLPKEDKK